MENSWMHPSSGVLKLWEKEPDIVERLFNDILYADASGDVTLVQAHMDKFLEEYESVIIDNSKVPNGQDVQKDVQKRNDLEERVFALIADSKDITMSQIADQLCSGKLLLDTKGVVFVQTMLY